MGYIFNICNISKMSKLSSMKCRMTALSEATKFKQLKIRRALNKVKTMFSTNPDLMYMAPELLLELIRFRLVKLSPRVDKIIQMLNELESSQNELNIVIREFVKFEV